jgi:hypothetical protein
MEAAYTGLRRLRLAGVDRPEAMPRMHRERWRAAAALRSRLFWQGRPTWMRPGAPVTSERVAAGS